MKMIVDAQKLIDQATSYGFELTAEDGDIKGNPLSKGAAIPQELIDLIAANKETVVQCLTAKPFTPTAPASRHELAAMLKRLECGECSAVRIYAHNLKAEVWFVRDDVAMQSDRVTFSLSELKACRLRYRALKKSLFNQKRFRR